MIGELREAAAERAAQYAEYEEVVRSRLQYGVATSGELHRLIREAGLPRRRFQGWLVSHQQFAERAGMGKGVHGRPNVIWRLK